MLAPETRTLLTDSLRPPDGYRVDIAVATSYSLDLAALLLAPMSFALQETDHNNFDAVDQIALLEALRRYAGRTTLFVQAGGIHPPGSFSVLMQLLEGSVVQVRPSVPGRIFHPKVWVLRFCDVGGHYLHRVLVLSRNLTFDRSWDTLLQLDESETDTESALEVEPLVRFVRELPRLAVDVVDHERQTQIDDLSATLERARFSLPADFTGGRFLPFGVGAAPWSFPTDAKRALLISPFLDVGSVKKWVSGLPRAIVLSRPESFDRVSAAGFDDAHETWTLQRPAEVEVGDDSPRVIPVTSEWATVRDGLHAKTFVFEQGKETTVVTGSANLTTAAFGGNVEFSVELSGPTSRCGIDATWSGSVESPGLVRLAERYTPAAFDAEAESRADLEMLIDSYHRELAANPPTATITAGEDDTVTVSMSLAEQTPSSPGETFIRPASLQTIRARLISNDISWSAQSRRDVTPFFVVDTSVERGGITVKGAAVVVARLAGDVGDRRSATMAEILRNANDVLRYLALLLADPRLDMAAAVGNLGSGPGFRGRGGFTDLVVLEPLIRASIRDDGAVDRVASLLEELTRVPEGRDLLPEGFSEIWEAIDTARRSTR